MDNNKVPMSDLLANIVARIAAEYIEGIVMVGRMSTAVSHIAGRVEGMEECGETARAIGSAVVSFGEDFQKQMMALLDPFMIDLMNMNKDDDEQA